MQPTPLALARLARNLGHVLRKWQKSKRLKGFRLVWSGQYPLGHVEALTTNDLYDKVDSSVPWTQRCAYYGWLEVQAACNLLIDRYRDELQDWGFEFIAPLTSHRYVIDFWTAGQLHSRFYTVPVPKAA